MGVDYSRMSRTDLVRALESSESAMVERDELKRLLRELQRHQLELELQNRELRESQQALEESRSRYAELYDFAPMACLSLDSRGCIQEINLTGAALLRRDRSQLIGQPLSPLVVPADVVPFLQHVRRCFAGESLVTELGLRPGGVRIRVRLHSAPHDGSSPQARLCRTALIDVTELRQMELRLSVAERLASVGTLAAGVAHEINNPLAFLSNNLELATRALKPLEREASVEKAFHALADARTGALRIQDIVKDLVAFARPEERSAGQVDVQQVLEVAVKMAMGEIRHRARLVRDYSDVPPVAATESHLGQVFLNLLVNAAHAIPEGSTERNEIRLCTRHQGGAVVVEVHDTGRGIPAEELGHIFDPFFTTKPVGQGMGLGLAISHSLVGALGGQLSVESEPGRGTVFRVQLPAAPVRQVAPPAAPVPAPSSATVRGAVLIVDDEPLLGQSLELLLSDSHDVTLTTCAREALALIQGGRRFHAILCDLMMAEMTGQQFHEQLSRSEPEQAQRIIFMTGGAFTQGSRDFLAKVPNAQLTKPFKLDQLERAIAALVPRPLPGTAAPR
jgi:signal transduction histidine kinase/CheY-like chemotaxis protein